MTFRGEDWKDALVRETNEPLTMFPCGLYPSSSPSMVMVASSTPPSSCGKLEVWCLWHSTGARPPNSVSPVGHKSLSLTDVVHTCVHHFNGPSTPNESLSYSRNTNSPSTLSGARKRNRLTTGPLPPAVFSGVSTVSSPLEFSPLGPLSPTL